MDIAGLIEETQTRGNMALSLIEDLKEVAGAAHVLTDPRATRSYRTGYRFGAGEAAAVVRPQGLISFWRALQACVAHGAAVIVQAANTGLTGGSTPDGAYDRPLVIISPMAIDGIHLIDEGRQVICLPGATLDRLEHVLAPLDREPHSVIGSSCIGASVMGGVCNNSGGALIRRGPVYTELALYARLDADGVLRLVNHLGLDIDGDPEAVLGRVERGDFTDAEIVRDTARASDADYAERVRDVDSATPARFNADPRGLFEASGCAGKLALFAVRLDTFAKERGTRVFYIGTNDPGELTALRRHMLSAFSSLPIAAEYMHRECFDIAERYGKDSYLAIRLLGTSRLPALLRWKARLETAASRLRMKGDGLADRLLQRAANLLPSHLPRRMREYRDRYEHHLMVRVASESVGETQAYLQSAFPSRHGDWFACDEGEGAAAFLHRFAAAGAAVRYRAIHAERVEGIVSLDIALPRNMSAWVETLPEPIAAPILHRLYYGHFFCHVFHQDYIVAKGTDMLALEHEMLALLDARGAEYPAEHNVGHLYAAKPALADFYRELDPLNGFNPGIGQTSRRARWQEAS